jgi:hypothetical protein
MNGTYEYSLAQIQNLPTTEALPGDGGDEFSHRGFTSAGEGDSAAGDKMEDFYVDPPPTSAGANGTAAAYPSPSPPAPAGKKQSRRASAAQVAQGAAGSPQPAIVLSPQGQTGSAGTPPRHMSMAAALGVSTGAHHYYAGPPHPPSHIPPYALAAAGHAHYLTALKGNSRSRGSGYRQARSGAAAYVVPPPMFMHPPTVKWPDPCLTGMPMTAAAAAAYHGVDPGKLLLRPSPSEFSGGPDFAAVYQRGEAAGDDAGGGTGEEGEDGGEDEAEDGGGGNSPSAMVGYSDTVKRYTVDAHNQVKSNLQWSRSWCIQARPCYVQCNILKRDDVFGIPTTCWTITTSNFVLQCSDSVARRGAGDERLLRPGLREPLLRGARHCRRGGVRYGAEAAVARQQGRRKRWQGFPASAGRGVR